MGGKESDMTEQLNNYICIHTHTHTHLYVCLVTQSCPISLWDPLDRSPSGSSVHEDSPGKNTGVGDHAPLQYIQTHIYKYVYVYVYIYIYNFLLLVTNLH